MDYRFRLEQDWDSRKSDGSMRENRTRLRYRFRTGATYKDDWYSMGFRIRTGDPNKQQDPQLTVGKGLEEFGTLPLGFEKIYFQSGYKNLKFWLGKNTFPFSKNNELFWSDNVYPEGVSLTHTFSFNDKIIQELNIKGGHFILSSNDQYLVNDTYFQGVQTEIISKNKHISLFPSLYVFRNVPDIPDGNENYFINYSILHLGTTINMLKANKLSLQLDYYENIEDYSSIEQIPDSFKDQTSGYTLGIRYGELKKSGSTMYQLTYSNLQKYSIVDFMAQNDWARWDYSSFDSPDGRLSNFNGIELVIAIALSEKIKFVTKYYNVNQLIAFGPSLETGQRIRFDLDIRL